MSRFLFRKVKGECVTDLQIKGQVTNQRYLSMFTNPGILIKFTGYNKIILTSLRWALNNLSNPAFQIWKHSSKCLATEVSVESAENGVHSLSEPELKTRNQIIRKLGYSWFDNKVISLSRPLAFQLAMSGSRNIIAKWQKRLGHIGKSLAHIPERSQWQSKPNYSFD